MQFVAAHADDTPVVQHQPVDGEAFTQRHAGRHRGIDEQLVEHGATRAEGHRRRVGARCAFDRHRAEVEGVGIDGWAPGRRERVAQAPARQRRDAARVHDVRRHGVAREGRAVDQQHAPAAAREQHRCGGAGAARADDDGVPVHRVAPRQSMPLG
ncbi:MAG: hypothetical protein QM722_24790 [Piscinibacter sp.]